MDFGRLFYSHALVLALCGWGYLDKCYCPPRLVRPAIGTRAHRVSRFLQSRIYMDFLDRRRGSHHGCTWRGSRLQVGISFSTRGTFDGATVSLDYTYCGQLNALEAFAWICW